MKIIYLLPTIILINSSFAATYILKDNLNANGSGAADNNALVEGSGVYNVTNGSPGNPSFYNALVVGASYGNTGSIWRTVINFDLSGLPPAAAGCEYVVSDVIIRMEQSGDRPAAQIDFYEGSYPTGTLSNYLATENYAANQSGNFVFTSLGPAIDLNTDSSFTFTLDAPNASSGEYQTFGSGLAPNNVGISGTNSPALSPQLEIVYEQVKIPEPSSITLFSLGLLGLVTRRKRSVAS